MRKLIGKIVEIDQNKITFELISDIPCNLLEEIKLEREDTLTLEISKHLIILKKL